MKIAKGTRILTCRDPGEAHPMRACESLATPRKIARPTEDLVHRRLGLARLACADQPSCVQVQGRVHVFVTFGYACPPILVRYKPPSIYDIHSTVGVPDASTTVMARALICLCLFCSLVTSCWGCPWPWAFSCRALVRAPCQPPAASLVCSLAEGPARRSVGCAQSRARRATWHSKDCSACPRCDLASHEGLPTMNGGARERRPARRLQSCAAGCPRGLIAPSSAHSS